MSTTTSPASTTRDRPSWLRRSRSLKARLLSAIVGLFALAMLIIGFVTTILLGSYLVGQVDEQLDGAFNRAQSAITGSGSSGGTDEGVPADLRRPGSGPGALTGLVTGDVVQAGVQGEQGNALPVSIENKSDFLDIRPGETQTIELVGYGDYRIEARNIAGGKVVVGLPLERTERAITRLIIVEGAVAVVALIGAGVAGSIVIGRNLLPLRRLAGTAQRVSKLPLAKGEVATLERVETQDADPRTEVGQVGSAFNEMIGHVERSLEARQESETRVRHFVADASHELRTPLAAIRGYAELTRRSRQSVPEDIAHALSRVESESARMTVLVEDLLLLARLDSGRPLSRDPVDLSALLIDAVSDAHATSPGHKWSLDLPDESITVPGDAARLHQVLANLLANARTHTPAGTDVRISLQPSADDRYVEVAVHDNGPGVPAELQPAVFERFARGDSSRARTTGSTGLGLAIVSAVCAAHGGTVSLDSVAGNTTFTVRLPR